MKNYYIDTCSLQWRYLKGKPTPFMDYLLEDAEKEKITAELTILEWSSALARAYRRGELDRQGYKANETALMTDIYSGKLKILTLERRTIEKARYLVEYIGVESHLNLRSGDAIHLTSALSASSNLGGGLVFLTSNKALANIVRSVAFVKEALDLSYLDPS